MPGSVTVSPKNPKRAVFYCVWVNLNIFVMLLEVTKGLGAATLVLASDLWCPMPMHDGWHIHIHWTPPRGSSPNTKTSLLGRHRLSGFWGSRDDAENTLYPISSQQKCISGMYCCWLSNRFVWMQRMIHDHNPQHLISIVAWLVWRIFC